MESHSAVMKPYVIGLDLGGTNSVFGIVDSRGEIKATTAIKTQSYETAEEFVAAAVDALQIIIDQVGGIEKIKAMGVGAPNGNFYDGTIEFAPNIKWGHNGIVPLAKMFSDKLGIPVGLTNDANAAAIGEMTYGVARGMKNFIVLTSKVVMTLMGYATDELDPKDYVDAHLFYDLVFAAFILVALMEIIKSHKWRTDNSGNLIANIFLHLFLPVGIVIAPIVGGIPYWVIKDYVPDLFIVSCLSVVLLAIGGILKLKNRRNP